MKNRLYLILTLLAIGCTLQGQANEKIDFYGCSVQSGADIVLQWAPVSSPAGFISYDVYHATGGGTFTKITSISNSTVTTWTHTDAATDYQVHRYYIQAQTTGTPILPSDTLFSVVTVAANLNDYEVKLTWDDYGPSVHPAAEPYYYIFRKTNGASWQLIDSTASNEYHDIPLACFNDLTYRISWCVYKNQNFSQVTLPLSDLSSPIAPAIDSVSIDDNDHIIFGWQQGLSPDTKDYIIFRYEGGIWDTLCRLTPASITSYIETGLNGTDGPHTFSIASVDQCDNATANLGIPDKVQTMLMAPVIHHVCDKQIELNWTDYINMPDSLAGYRLMVSTNNGPFAPFDTVGPDTLTGFFNNPQLDTFYRFKVVAFNNSGITSSSSTASILVRNPKAPQFAYIRYATVEKNRIINLAIVNDTTAQSAGLVIERSQLSPLQFTPLDTLEASGGTLYYADSTVRPTREAYLYRVLALDSCSSAVIESNQTNSIWLELADGATGELEWTPHEGFPNGLSHYRVDRRIADSIWQNIAEITGSTTFSDSEYPELTPETSIEYRITAISYPNDIFSAADSAASNVITAVPAYRMFIPTAFSPRSETNSIFKPHLLSVDPRDYYFAVFSRQGQRIFETSNPDTGWDGTVNGDKVKAGVYAYYVRILTAKGRYEEQRGMVTLVE